MNDIKNFLKLSVSVLKQSNVGKISGWYSIMDFMLHHGKLWTPRPLPECLKPMRVGECFKNAADLALGFHRNDYIYCEGYALGIIPVPHAWCVDLKGNVIDPTWCQRGGHKMLDLGREYFGIAFKSAYVSHALLKQNQYGLVDAWQSNWPLLSAPVDDWRHPIMLRRSEQPAWLRKEAA